MIDDSKWLWNTFLWNTVSLRDLRVIFSYSSITCRSVYMSWLSYKLTKLEAETWCISFKNIATFQLLWIPFQTRQQSFFINTHMMKPQTFKLIEITDLGCCVLVWPLCIPVVLLYINLIKWRKIRGKKKSC